MAGMMRRRAARRSCIIHGDNGCEIQGEAGPVERAQERRLAEVEIGRAFADWRDESAEWAELTLATARDWLGA